jgi:hypothetical protein
MRNGRSVRAARIEREQLADTIAIVSSFQNYVILNNIRAHCQGILMFLHTYLELAFWERTNIP